MTPYPRRAGWLRRILASVALWGAPALATVPISGVDVRVDGQTDIPRVLDLLGLKEGDAYSEAEAERGLIRLADSGKFLGLSSSFDPVSGRFELRLSLVPQAKGVDVRLRGQNVPPTLESDVRDVTGISPGDPIFPDQLGAIRDRVLTRLHDRGYASAQAVVSLERRSGSPDLRVAIAVELGSRTMVRQIELHGFKPGDADELFEALELPGRSLPLGLSGKVRDFYPVNIPLDSIRIDEAVASWNQKGRSEGYYDFQLKSSQVEGANGVILRLSLEKGPRFNLQFSGNVEFWERDLRAKVTDRPLRLGVPLNLQESEALILREYESAGYPEAEVKIRVEDRRDERLIRFDINEGRKLLLGKVTLPGVPDAESTNFARLVADWLKQYRDPFKRMPYDDKFLKAELPNLLARIRSLGYLDARILEMRAFIPPSGSNVDVEFPIQLGEKFTIRSVGVTGNISLSREELDHVVDISPGDVADPSKILSVRDQLFRKYQELGFLNVKVAEGEAHIIKKAPESNEVEIDYVVDQGPLIRVGKAMVEGLRRTKEAVVLRELSKDTLKPGDIWTPSGTEELEQRLLNTNIFGSVSFEPVGGRILQRASSDGTSVEVQQKDLKISLAERPAGSFEFGPGFRTDKGILGFAEFNYRNLGGWNRGVQLRAEMSRRLKNYQFLEQKLSLTYLEPFILDQRIGLRFNVQYEKDDQTVFTRKGWQGNNLIDRSFSFSTETNLTRKLRWIHNLYTFSRPSIFYPSERFVHDPDDKSSVNERKKLQIGSIGTSLTYDNRDNYFNPTEGWLLSANAEYASPLLFSQSDVNYAYYRQEGVTYAQLAPDNVVALSLAYSRIWALGPGSSVPLPRRLTLGGYGSIRSLANEALRFNDKDMRDQQAVEAKFEYRQPIFYGIGMAYFIDAGQLDAFKFGSTGWRYGLGVGFRYKTVVGPLAIDVAYNANPQHDASGRISEDVVKVWLNLGAF